MEIITTSIKSIVPYSGNPRKNEAAVKKVAASIREFGFRQPIVVDDQMVVIAGHTRLLAAKSLGMAEVPVHIARGLSPEKVRAYRLADNRTNEEAEWDEEKLRAELAALQDEGFDMALTGFDHDELATILEGIDFAPGTESDQGKLDELAPKIVACPHCGEKWDLREHGQG